VKTPISTYRLQIRPGFTLQDAAGLTGYLRSLGVDWVYVSPILTAEQGSDHGYDVTDPSTVDPRAADLKALRPLPGRPANRASASWQTSCQTIWE